MALTNIEIKNAQLRDKEYVMSDDVGLAVLLTPNGSKLWRYWYSRDGRKQKISLSSYPELSLVEVRVR